MRGLSAPIPVYGYREGFFAVKYRDPSPYLSIKMHQKVCVPQPVCVHGPLGIFDQYGQPQLTLLWPDIQDAGNQVAACVHRFGCDMPTPNKERISDYYLFSTLFIKHKLDPLRPEECKAFETWLELSKYDTKRKDMLAMLRERTDKLAEEVAKAKSFVKNEGYENPKAARGINSYSDASKALLGAIISDVDAKTFKMNYFVKGTNPRDWPKRLEQEFGCERVVETDFSSFEAHHRDEYSKVVHFWIMHMIRNVVDAGLKRLISQLVKGANIVQFKHLTAVIKQRLMSGAMWTSSSNAMLNLTSICYMSLRSKYPNLTAEELIGHLDEFKGLFEGDDGIFVDMGISEQMRKDMGVNLDFHCVSEYGKASFCGIICCDGSEGVVTDPIKFIKKIFYLDKNYTKSKQTKQLTMLRAKAMSYLTSYAKCPIIGPICKHICDCTSGFDVSSARAETDWWHRDSLDLAIAEKPWNKPRSEFYLPEYHANRVLVSERFGVSIETQMRIERSIKPGVPAIYCDLSEFMTDDQVLFKHDHFGHALAATNRTPIIENILRNGLARKKKIPKHMFVQPVEPLIGLSTL